MSLPNYESPTFLSQKDVYLAGLSLPQLMMLLLLAGGCFLFTLLLPYGMVVKLGVTAVLTVLSGVLLFGKVSGLSIPKYALLSLVRIFVRPGFEERVEFLVAGDAPWLLAQERRATAQATRAERARGKVAQSKAALGRSERQQAELKAEANKSVSAASMAVEQNAKGLIRSIFKG